MEKLHQHRYLAPQLKLSLENAAGVRNVHSVHLCGIDLPLARHCGRMKPDCSEICRQFALTDTFAAIVEKLHPVQLHLVHVTYADYPAALVHAVDREFQSDRLHESVLATFPDTRPGKI